MSGCVEYKLPGLEVNDRRRLIKQTEILQKIRRGDLRGL